MLVIAELERQRWVISEFKVNMVCHASAGLPGEDPRGKKESQASKQTNLAK